MSHLKNVKGTYSYIWF